MLIQGTRVIATRDIDDPVSKVFISAGSEGIISYVYYGDIAPSKYLVAFKQGRVVVSANTPPIRSLTKTASQGFVRVAQDLSNSEKSLAEGEINTSDGDKEGRAAAREAFNDGEILPDEDAGQVASEVFNTWKHFDFEGEVPLSDDYQTAFILGFVEELNKLRGRGKEAQQQPQVQSVPVPQVQPQQQVVPQPPKKVDPKKKVEKKPPQVTQVVQQPQVVQPVPAAQQPKSPVELTSDDVLYGESPYVGHASTTEDIHYVRMLLEEGMDPEAVAKATGVSIEFIDKIQEDVASKIRDIVRSIRERGASSRVAIKPKNKSRSQNTKNRFKRIIRREGPDRYVPSDESGPKLERLRSVVEDELLHVLNMGYSHPRYEKYIKLFKYDKGTGKYSVGPGAMAIHEATGVETHMVQRVLQELIENPTAYNIFLSKLKNSLARDIYNQILQTQAREKGEIEESPVTEFLYEFQEALEFKLANVLHTVRHMSKDEILGDLKGDLISLWESIPDWFPKKDRDAYDRLHKKLHMILSSAAREETAGGVRSYINTLLNSGTKIVESIGKERPIPTETNLDWSQVEGSLAYELSKAFSSGALRGDMGINDALRTVGNVLARVRVPDQVAMQFPEEVTKLQSKLSRIKTAIAAMDSTQEILNYLKEMMLAGAGEALTQGLKTHNPLRQSSISRSSQLRGRPTIRFIRLDPVQQALADGVIALLSGLNKEKWSSPEALDFIRKCILRADKDALDELEAAVAEGDTSVVLSVLNYLKGVHKNKYERSDAPKKTLADIPETVSSIVLTPADVEEIKSIYDRPGLLNYFQGVVDRAAKAGHLSVVNAKKLLYRAYNQHKSYESLLKYIFDVALMGAGHGVITPGVRPFSLSKKKERDLTGRIGRRIRLYAQQAPTAPTAPTAPGASEGTAVENIIEEGEKSKGTPEKDDKAPAQFKWMLMHDPQAPDGVIIDVSGQGTAGIPAVGDIKSILKVLDTKMDAAAVKGPAKFVTVKNFAKLDLPTQTLVSNWAKEKNLQFKVAKRRVVIPNMEFDAAAPFSDVPPHSVVNFVKDYATAKSFADKFKDRGVAWFKALFNAIKTDPLYNTRGTGGSQYKNKAEHVILLIEQQLEKSVPLEEDIVDLNDEVKASRRIVRAKRQLRLSARKVRCCGK